MFQHSYNLWAPSKYLMMDINIDENEAHLMGNNTTNKRSLPPAPSVNSSPRPSSLSFIHSPVPSLLFSDAITPNRISLGTPRSSPSPVYLSNNDGYNSSTSSLSKHNNNDMVSPQPLQHQQQYPSTCSNSGGSYTCEELDDEEFQHIIKPIIKMAHATICRYWLTNQCTRENCSYAHDYIEGITPFTTAGRKKQRRRKRADSPSDMNQINGFHNTQHPQQRQLFDMGKNDHVAPMWLHTSL